MTKISVIMPAYNAEKYIGEAIESILNQTYKDFEFIIINDGSIDKTKEKILSYQDKRIVYLENKKNLGIVATLNKGLDYATGEFIARMDSDDISAKTRFEKQIDYFNKNSNVGVLGTGICIFGEGIKEQKRIFTTDSKLLKAELLFNSCIAHPTVMMRRSILEKYNLRYESEFAGAEDYCLWWKIAQVSNISTLPDILLNYRMHDSQITKKKDGQYFEMMNRLMKKRFADIGYSGTIEEQKIFMKYCLGEYGSYSEEEMKIFINCLNDIRKVNKVSNYFDQKELTKILESAIACSLNKVSLSNEKKKSLYQYVVKTGIFTLITRLKVKYHQVYKR